MKRLFHLLIFDALILLLTIFNKDNCRVVLKQYLIIQDSLNFIISAGTKLKSQKWVTTVGIWRSCDHASLMYSF